jgi:ubiquinone/menaquinone biosynthesis C-methylase UbiE
MGIAAQTSSLDLADNARGEVADLLHLQLSPLGLAAMDALAPQPRQTIVDIGCGAGQTVQQLASRVGPLGHVIGVDIAPRVLEIARSRTAGLSQVRLIQADAATLALPNEMADGVYSRFGVMALDDPVAAFANFRRITRAGGRLAFVCWRSLEENELDLVPLQAAGLDIPVDKTPFKFERRDYLLHVLRSAGFAKINIDPFDARVSSGNLDAMVRVLTKVGALGKILRETPALLAGVEPKIRAVLMAGARDRAVSLKAATWIVSAAA